MNNKTKQTALDILFHRIKLKADSIPTNNQANRLIKGAYVDCLMLIIESKEMEKQRLEKTWIEALDYGINNLKGLNNLSSKEAFDKYYNETYGGNK